LEVRFHVVALGGSGTFKTGSIKLASVVQACSLSYSGGRGLENHGLKPAQGNSLR
jgi:hypothetical protein